MTPPAKRRFAQHYLESAWVDRVIHVIDPSPDDVILEIGPGRGALTLPLARTGARVVAVEIDSELVTDLSARVPATVTLVHADFLEVDLAGLPLPRRGLRVVGNLPYNVSAPILTRLLRASASAVRFRDAVLMLQREVADRVTATAGEREWGPLSILTTLHAEATRLLTLPPGAFRPMPKVTSAIVRLRFRPPSVAIAHPQLLQALVRDVFTQRRKTALNASRRFIRRVTTLSPDAVFDQAGVDPRCRPHQLGLAELADLTEVLASGRR